MSAHTVNAPSSSPRDAQRPPAGPNGTLRPPPATTARNGPIPGTRWRAPHTDPYPRYRQSCRFVFRAAPRTSYRGPRCMSRISCSVATCCGCALKKSLTPCISAQPHCVEGFALTGPTTKVFSTMCGGTAVPSCSKSAGYPANVWRGSWATPK